MKRLTKIAFAALSLSLLVSFSFAANAANKKGNKGESLKPFPEASEGMVRHVIQLPQKSNEDNYKVEIIPGKTMSVDCNIHRLIGNLEEKNLDGWGYTYYEFSSNGDTASTLMACNGPDTTKFVVGDSRIVRYNSKLPLVVYAPKGFDVQYKIWKADKTQVSAVK